MLIILEILSGIRSFFINLFSGLLKFVKEHPVLSLVLQVILVSNALTYHFTATEGSDCEDQLAAAGGDFDALPCDVHYNLDGARTGDAK